MRQRTITAVILLPIGLGLIYLGGWAFAAFVVLVLGLAAWEYGRIFRNGGYTPAEALVIGGAAGLALARQVFGFTYADVLVTALVLAAMTWHVVGYEGGQSRPGTSFAITLGGIFYLGWLGAYLISLRNLANGLYWFLLALPAVWLADTGAYMIGRKIGRHKLAPRVSPNKSWEGYLGGIVTGSAGTALLAGLFLLLNPAVKVAHGAVIGVVISTLTTLGDLGESMINREFGVKDTSNLIPGHGGVMDRIDSWIWTAAISYYLVTWLW